MNVRDVVARVESARRRPPGEGEQTARAGMRGSVGERPRREELRGAGASYVGHAHRYFAGAGGGGGGVCPHSQGDMATLWNGLPSAPVWL
ncbi:hypothetical protein STTU_p0120 (plasmid) [Streptomyces sp. Tu6071]|nr:hypothetical protein STTU_p0120 [Streptomyces sp. Tu6071]